LEGGFRKTSAAQDFDSSADDEALKKEMGA
jgi:hypothetical protein